MNLLDVFIDDQLLLPSLLVVNEQRREVWICVRTDGSRGDGTKENPYDGSTADVFDDLMSNVDLIKEDS
jgi:hypothetical protein